MLNKSLMLTVLLAMTAMLSGCASVKVHLEDRARVDQDIPGMPPAPVKTRQVIVVEVNEKAQNTDVVQKVKEEDMTSQGKAVTRVSDTTVVHASNLSFPGKTAQTLTQSPALEGWKEYTVAKDDTLQKISKKFYGSYSQWTRIYDANKTVIKNPNFVKPGVVLKIPNEGILVDKNYPPVKGPVTDHQ